MKIEEIIFITCIKNVKAIYIIMYNVKILKYTVGIVYNKSKKIQKFNIKDYEVVVAI
ncbi:MAG: hypothetical protein LBQ07_02685 [Endomicrobium sp.]|jgi:hypothetical protein|nr:hypothetical protein [Endomicrobium sp.]